MAQPRPPHRPPWPQEFPKRVPGSASITASALSTVFWAHYSAPSWERGQGRPAQRGVHRRPLTPLPAHPHWTRDEALSLFQDFVLGGFFSARPDQRGDERGDGDRHQWPHLFARGWHLGRGPPGFQASREALVRMSSKRRGQGLATAWVPRFCPQPVTRRRAEVRWRSRTTWPRALRAVLTDFRSGNIAATSGSSTTMIVSLVKRSGYLPRTPREKSYSGNISSEFRLERPFLIVAPFPWCGSGQPQSAVS